MVVIRLSENFVYDVLAHISVHDAVGSADDGRILWTDEAVRRLHVAVLHHALGVLERRVSGDLGRFKEFIEKRQAPTGAWRGEIHGGTVEPRRDGTSSPNKM